MRLPKTQPILTRSRYETAVAPLTACLRPVSALPSPGSGEGEGHGSLRRIPHRRIPLQLTSPPEPWRHCRTSFSRFPAQVLVRRSRTFHPPPAKVALLKFSADAFRHRHDTSAPTARAAANRRPAPVAELGLGVSSRIVNA